MPGDLCVVSHGVLSLRNEMLKHLMRRPALLTQDPLCLRSEPVEGLEFGVSRHLDDVALVVETGPRHLIVDEDVFRPCRA